MVTTRNKKRPDDMTYLVSFTAFKKTLLLAMAFAIILGLEMIVTIIFLPIIISVGWYAWVYYIVIFGSAGGFLSLLAIQYGKDRKAGLKNGNIIRTTVMAKEWLKK